MVFENFSIREIYKSIFQYPTNKVSVIRNYKAGWLLRILQISIIVIYLGIVMLYKKGYQTEHGVSSSVVVKVKGIGVSRRTDIPRKIWDIADSVVPPQEENAIFIITNAIKTANQTQGVCAEDPNVENAKCENESGCEKDKTLYLGNGIMTGNCVNVGDGQNKTCEIWAWCPIANDTINKTDKPLLDQVPDFTVFIRNLIIFEKLNIQRSNTFTWKDGKNTEKCVYDANNESLKYCPIFKVSTLIGDISQRNLTELELLTLGGVLRVIITWNCNLDYHIDYCKPEYSFSGIFLYNNNYTKGWSLRYADYHENNYKEYRNLYKVNGLRILIEVRGKGRKFDIEPFLVSIGSGIAYISVAAVFCDILFSLVCPKNKFYHFKFEEYSKQDNGDVMQDEEVKVKLSRDEISSSQI